MKYRKSQPAQGNFRRGGSDGRQSFSSGPSLPDGKSMADLWPGYLKDGYFTKEGTTRRELFDRRKFLPVLEELQVKRFTNSQLRRFFQHCRIIEARLRSGKYTWGQVAPDFLKLDAVAADAAGKRPPKIPRVFHDFIELNVQAVRKEEDFLDGFMRHFEALVGFSSLYLKDKNRQ